MGSLRTPARRADTFVSVSWSGSTFENLLNFIHSRHCEEPSHRGNLLNIILIMAPLKVEGEPSLWATEGLSLFCLVVLYG